MTGNGGGGDVKVVGKGGSALVALVDCGLEYHVSLCFLFLENMVYHCKAFLIFNPTIYLVLISVGLKLRNNGTQGLFLC